MENVKIKNQNYKTVLILFLTFYIVIFHFKLIYVK